MSLASTTTNKPRGEGLTYLEQHALWDGVREFGLDLPTKLCEALGNPQDQYKTLHVAGTNGKGSVSAMLAAVFNALGCKVGQFTSPHLIDPTERCVVGGKPCDAERFDSALLEVKRAAETCGVDPSFFEITTAASFVEFGRREVDYAVIEVGLGGRLDATNVLSKPEASVITSIGLDHTAILGDSLEKIAAEKAGIIKRGVPVYTGDLPQGALKVVEQTAAARGAEVVRIERCDREFVAGCKLALRGKHQLDNASLVVRVARSLGVADEVIRYGLECVRWPARLEFFDGAGDDLSSVLLDAAHNEDGIKSVLTYLESPEAQLENFDSLVFVVAVLSRKDWEKMCALLSEFADRNSRVTKFIATTCDNKTSVDPKLLQNLLPRADVIEDPLQALKQARSVGPRSLSVILGSSYLAGELRPQITAEPFSTWSERDCS
ncbi:MAG: bifunctional folylpolyglutamate synthase/dihydrofolate synthase [Bdellovibrionales bacterium]|nr:bifunctional folylpolyglutamate synthase/dihydrofolate synthase [Bdellovibrionales bacterium]